WSGPLPALNAGPVAAHLQRVGPHPSNANSILAGLQDNGTVKSDGTKPLAQSVTNVDDQDCAFAIFDSANPSLAYHSFATVESGPSIARSTDSGKSWDSGSATNAIRAALSAANDAGAGFY